MPHQPGHPFNEEGFKKLSPEAQNLFITQSNLSDDAKVLFRDKFKVPEINLNIDKGTVDEGDAFLPPLGEIVPGKSGETVVSAGLKGLKPGKALDFVGTIAGAMNPIANPETGVSPLAETIINVGKLGIGTVELAIPGEQGMEQFPRAFGDFIVQKYGGKDPDDAFENFKIALEDNAFEVASDFSVFVTGIGGALKLTSKIGGKMKLTNQIAKELVNIAEESGTALVKTGKGIDPVGLGTAGVARVAQSRKAVNTLIKSAVNFSPDPKLTNVQKLEKVDQLAADFLTTNGPNRSLFTGKNKGLRVKRSSIDKLQTDINKLKGTVNNIIEVKTSEGLLIKTNDLVKGIDDVLADMDKFGLGGVDEIVNRKEIVKLRKQFIDAKGLFLSPTEVQNLKKGLNKGFTANVADEFSQVKKTINDRLRFKAKEQLELAHPQLKGLNAKEGVLIELQDAIAKRLKDLEGKPPVPTLGLVSAGLATGVVGGAASQSLQAGAAFAVSSFIAGKILTSPNVQIATARAIAAANMKLAKAGKLPVVTRPAFQAGRLKDIPSMTDQEIAEELGIGGS